MSQRNKYNDHRQHWVEVKERRAIVSLFWGLARLVLVLVLIVCPWTIILLVLLSRCGVLP